MSFKKVKEPSLEMMLRVSSVAKIGTPSERSTINRKICSEIICGAAIACTIARISASGNRSRCNTLIWLPLSNTSCAVGRVVAISMACCLGNSLTNLRNKYIVLGSAQCKSSTTTSILSRTKQCNHLSRAVCMRPRTSSGLRPSICSALRLLNPSRSASA